MAKVTTGSRKRKDNTKPGGKLPPLEFYEPHLCGMLQTRLPPMGVVIISGDDFASSIAWVAEPEYCDKWAEQFNADPIDGVHAVSVPIEYRIAGRIFDGGKVGAA